MLRKTNEAVSEGNGPVHQEEEFGFGQPAPVDECREIRSQLDKLKELIRRLEQHLLSQEHEARQPRLAMETDGPANTKTQERTEGAAKAVQAMRGDSCTAEQKVQDGPKASITFSVEAEPPDLPCREDVLAEEGATSPESCLPSLEMRSSTAAGGLVSTGEASIATETNLNQPHLRFCSIEDTGLEANCKRTSTPYASYDSSSFWRLLAAPYCRRVVETKSRQNRTFDPGGSQGHLRACPVWDRGARWFVVRLYGLKQLVTSCSVFSEEISWLFETRPALMSCQEKVLPSRAARGYMNWREERRSSRR